MKREIRQIKPGEIFYLFGDKIHYVGCLTTGEEPIHIFWTFGRYKRRRFYKAVPQWELEIEWEYMRKTRKKRVCQKKLNSFN